MRRRGRGGSGRSGQEASRRPTGRKQPWAAPGIPSCPCARRQDQGLHTSESPKAALVQAPLGDPQACRPHSWAWGLSLRDPRAGEGALRHLPARASAQNSSLGEAGPTLHAVFLMVKGLETGGLTLVSIPWPLTFPSTHVTHFPPHLSNCSCERKLPKPSLTPLHTFIHSSFLQQFLDCLQHGPSEILSLPLTEVTQSGPQTPLKHVAVLSCCPVPADHVAPPLEAPLSQLCALPADAASLSQRTFSSETSTWTTTTRRDDFHHEDKDKVRRGHRALPGGSEAPRRWQRSGQKGQGPGRGLRARPRRRAPPSSLVPKHLQLGDSPPSPKLELTCSSYFYRGKKKTRKKYLNVICS